MSSALFEHTEQFMEERNFLLQSIVEKRTVPGFLIFDGQGKILFRNRNAQWIFGGTAHCQGIMKQIVDRFLSGGGQTLNEVDSNAEITQAIIRVDDLAYGIRAFRLSNQSIGFEPVVGVLIEKISTDRLNLPKALNHFQFSPRQIDVLRELQSGKTDKMIAAKLEISPETVHGYLKTIRAKLGVSTRTEILHKLHSL